jgi:ParB family chromosome partitioning protein
MAERTQHGGKSPRLGRGLSSLIVNSAAEDAGHYAPGRLASDGEAGRADGKPLQVATAEIAANPYQPRRTFDEGQLNDLADSIRTQGILQPLVVTRSVRGDGERPYVLVAGERRLRAAQLAGLGVVPCVVREATGREMLEWALVENLQRADLNPIERARGYRQYMDRFDVGQAEVAERLSQPRSTVANHLRLLELCEECQEMLAAGDLSFGHGKVLAALIGSPGRQVELARRVVAEGLSVRALEEMLAAASEGADAPERRSRARRPPYLADIEERLAAAVGTRVRILPGRRKHSGRIVIEYYTLDDFDRISERLGVSGADTAS